MGANDVASPDGRPPDSSDYDRLRATLDSLLDPHLIVSPVSDESGDVVDFQFDDVNDAACRYYGLSRDELLGSSLLDHFPGLVGTQFFARFAEVIETGVPLVLDGAPYLNDRIGQERYYDVRGVRMDGTLVFTVRDVTERHEAAKRLAESEERYRLLAENAWDVIWTMGVDGSITYVSPSVQRLRGITPAEAAAQTLDEIHPPGSAALVAEYFGRLYAAMETGTVPPAYHGEHEYYRKDGSIMLGELDVIPQVDADGNVVQILGVTRDISERRRFQEELEHLAVTDPLTGVWNRREGEELFSADLAEAHRYRLGLSVLMIDIDYFKRINDNFGHETGDGVLIDLSRRLAQNLRSSDVLARWGGDEFVIATRHRTIADAITLAEKLRKLVAGTRFDGVGTVTVSIGATQLKPDDDVALLIGRADRALYQAKEAGRNVVKAYE